MVTFNVDMSSYAETFEKVYVSGSFNGWAGESNLLTDEDQDGVWSGTFEIPGGNHEFKFTLDNWAVQENFEEGASCTVTNGGFTNRALSVDGDLTLCFPWNACESCLVGTNDLTLNPNLVFIHPNVVRNFTQLKFAPNVGEKQVELWDLNGRLVWQKQLPTGQDQYQLEMSNYQSGIYLLRVSTDEMVITKRMIKQ